MDISDRLYKEDPLFQGINEIQTYSFDTTPWGVSSPIGGTVKLYNESNTDISGTAYDYLSGTVTVDGSTIYTPMIQNLDAGVKYKLAVQFGGSDGQIKSPWCHLYGQDLDSSACRSGMKNIVKRIRQLTNADVHEMAIGGDVYWSDVDIQDVADRHKTLFIEKDLEFEPQYQDGTVVYYLLPTELRYLEEPESGASRWIIRDSEGVECGTANYTYDHSTGIITFSSDTGGTVSYNLTCYTYDVYATAADIWEWRLANFSLWYDFRTENKTMSRSQAFKQAQIMREAMSDRKGSNIYGEGDMRASNITRADVKATT